MNPYVVIILCIFTAGLGMFTFGIQAATLYWGQRLGGMPPEEQIIAEQLAAGKSLAEARGYAMGYLATNRGFQDAITPPAQTNRMIFLILCHVAIITLCCIYFRWYWGIVAVFATIAATGILRAMFFPPPSSSFYRDILVRSLIDRKAACLRAQDHVRAAACDHFIKRFQADATQL
jgi:hypothetical protein